MFNIAYGEMHEYVAWKRKASLNSFDNSFHYLWYYLEILKMFCLVLFGKLIENLIARNDFNDLENFMDILVIGKFYETTWKVNYVF